MPVRQERLISLINAAIDYRSLAFTVKGWLSLPQLQHMTRDELIGQITQWIAYIDDALIERAANHDTAITLEYHNLNRNRVRNERAKINMRAKRQLAGVIPRAQPINLNEARRLTQRPEVIDKPKPIYDVPLSQRRQSPEHTQDEIDEINRLEAENRRKQEEAENQPFHQDKQPVPLTFPENEEQ